MEPTFLIAGALRVYAEKSGDDLPAYPALRGLGWRCVAVVWCQHYCRIPALKPEYMSHKDFFDAVEYFHVSAEFQSLTIHFKRTSRVYKLCVCPAQLDRVVQRGGFHASDGHVVIFDFSKSGKQWSNRCFDEKCVQAVESWRGTKRGEITDCLMKEACLVFGKL